SLRLPSQVTGLRSAVRPEHSAERPVVTVLRPVTRRYFETTGIPLTAGRPFEASDRRGAPRVAIVNRSFVRTVLREAPALGARVTSDLVEGTIAIVGVAADVTPPGDVDRPALYVSLDQLEVAGGSLIVSTDGNPRRVLPELRGRLKTVAPALARD